MKSLEFSKNVHPAHIKKFSKEYNNLAKHRKKRHKDLIKQIDGIVASVNDQIKKDQIMIDFNKFNELVKSNGKLYFKDVLKNYKNRKNIVNLFEKNKEVLKIKLSKELSESSKILKLFNKGDIKIQEVFDNTTFSNNSIKDILLPENVEEFVDWSNVNPTTKVFKPPYDTKEVYTTIYPLYVIDEDQYTYDHFDNSRAYNEVGFVNNKLYIRATDDAKGAYHITFFYDSFVSNGVLYQMPKSGKLIVDIMFKNLSNKYLVSLFDNFGLSTAWIKLFNRIFLNILPFGNDETYEFELIYKKINNDGDDEQFDLDFSNEPFPIGIRFQTSRSFQEDENLLIMVGSHVSVLQRLNDMDSNVDVDASWFIEAITVSVE